VRGSSRRDCSRPPRSRHCVARLAIDPRPDV
jgi:hypothetical protein